MEVDYNKFDVKNMFKDAIKTLHNLQSNASYLRSVKRHSALDQAYKPLDTKHYLLRTGITLEKLDTLSVIHVAGTKGKGSTCAFTEAILRKHGFSTGFFSSPHLVSVRERIRINGQPISQLQFAWYFWKVYKRLEETKEHETDMPTYFKFLTVLMFNIFLDLNIEVAIVEVGIGGQGDSTNIIRNPVCVGITSLGLEHTSLLGNTLEEIAYQKSGIFKQNTVAFTVPQPVEAMRVLEKRAIEKGCELHVIPPFEKYTWKNITTISDKLRTVQKQNASLAIQMAVHWIFSKTDKCSLSCDNVNSNGTYGTGKQTNQINILERCIEFPEIVCMDKVALGLSYCKWPGRTQILRSSVATFFLDGAHTIESIEYCISWFKYMTRGSKAKKYLIFNTTGDRDSARLLTPLKGLNFDKAYFVPNSAGVKSVDDDTNCPSTNEQKLLCLRNSETWGINSVVANNVLEVLQDIRKNSEKNVNCDKPDVLITGSLHLVGAVLTILDPNLTMTTKF